MPGNGYLLSFAKVNNGSILVGVWGDGIYRYDTNFNNIPLNIPGIDEVNGLPVWDMAVLKDRRTVWLVGQPGFIYVYDEIANTAKRYEPPIFNGRTIRQVEEDDFGNIWLGSHSQGLIKWMPSRAEKKFEDGFYKVKSIPNVRIQKITLDSKGFIWVCTNKEGVYKINTANDSIVAHLTKKDGVPGGLLARSASAVYEYNDSIMIIATGGLNLYNTKTKKIIYITSADGLPSNAVVSIEKDKSGYLWLGLMNGLCRMNLEKRTFSFFDRSDGINNDNFQVSASYRLPEGRLMFGSSSDFVVFNPDDVKTTIQPPNVTITDFRLLDKSLKVDSLLQLSKIELPADQSSLTIGFAALSYTNKNKLVYYYMLEDIDKVWHKADELNQAVYNYLPPGKYIFKVKGRKC
jgi:ligand-binding sensor domain-containing protein